MSARTHKPASRRPQAANPLKRKGRGRSDTSARTKPPSRSPRAISTNKRRVSSPSLRTAGGGKDWHPEAGEVGIRIRMYRVGFGDFFLITCLGRDGQAKHIVIDCGVFKGKSGTGDIGSIESAVAHMMETTEGKLALIVMTHRHADHISGFARCAEQFRSMTVEAVWMPIWESEYEPTAVKFQEELSRTAAGLLKHFDALEKNATLRDISARQFMENALGEDTGLGLAGERGNAAALELLKRGFKGVQPNFYQRGDKVKLPQSLVDAGLTCRILGPPPLSELDLMKLMDLQKNVGQHLADSEENGGSAIQPFPSNWKVVPLDAFHSEARAQYSPESFKEWVLTSKNKRKSRQRAVSVEEALSAMQRMENTLHQLQPIAALTAAKQLNGFLNNQSLVLLLSYKGKRLLFAGDAQAGNWEHWLFDIDAPRKEGTGELAKEAQAILGQLDLYKVGHHGSGNATPIVALKAMQNLKLTCLCSTEAYVYGEENVDDPSKGSEVPRLPLLHDLASTSTLVRSDQLPIRLSATETVPPRVSSKLPAAAQGTRIEPFDLGVDCFL